MADQTLAENSALRGREIGSVAPWSKVLRRIGKSWSFSWYWAQYLLVGSKRGVPGVADFVLGDHFFRALQVKSELVALGEIVKGLNPERAMEIGTASGGTLLFLTRLASPRATIVSVDLPGGRFGGGYRSERRWIYERFARHGQRLHLLRCDAHSDETLDRVRSALHGQPLDYLLIDGDHTYEGVKMDFEMYAPLVRSGGIVALHDIAEHPPEIGCEVYRFWNEIKSHYRHAEIIESRRQGWAGIGVLYVG